MFNFTQISPPFLTRVADRQLLICCAKPAGNTAAISEIFQGLFTITNRILGIQKSVITVWILFKTFHYSVEISWDTRLKKIYYNFIYCILRREAPLWPGIKTDYTSEPILNFGRFYPSNRKNRTYIHILISRSSMLTKKKFKLCIVPINVVFVERLYIFSGFIWIPTIQQNLFYKLMN